MGIPKKATSDWGLKDQGKMSLPGLESEPPEKTPKKTPPRTPRAKTPPPAKKRTKPSILNRGKTKASATATPPQSIPKSEYDSEGRPILHLDDMDLRNLEGEANKYLSHLRIPPDREEMKRLRAERARQELEREKKFASNSAALEEKNPTPEFYDGDSGDDEE